MKSRRIFFLGLVVLALVLSVSILFGFQLYKGTVEERQAADVARSADYVQSEMDARLAGHQRSAELWAQNAALERHGGDDQRVALGSFVNATGFSGASVIAANGTMTEIVAGLSDRQRRDLVGSDFGDREYFRRAMAGETYVSEPVQAESGNYIVTISTPIRRDGEVVGTLNGAFHLSEGAFFASAASSLGPTKGLTVRSRSGEAIYDEAPGPGADILVRNATLTETAWTVSVRESRSVIQPAIRRLTTLQVGALLLVVLSIAGFGWWNYRRNLKQVDRLLDGFDALEDHEYGAAVDVGGSEEWERIGAGFNEMSRTLDRYFTEREDRERELRRFRRAVEAAGHAVFLTDTDGIIEYANPAFEKITGYDREEAVGSTPSILNSGEMSDAYFEDQWETILSGEVWAEAIVNRRADGELYHAHQTIAPIVDDEGIEAFVAIQTDITDHKEREEQLQLTRRAMEEAPVGIVISDPSLEDNPLVYVNQHFLDLTGYSEEDVIGHNCRFLQGEHTQAQPVTEMREAIGADEPVTVELRNYRADGTEFWNRVSIAPVTDDDDEVTHYIGFQEDVTDRKERERQLWVLGRVLRHNLRNDMSVIRGWAESIRAKTDDEIATDADRIVEKSDALLDATEKQRAITEVLLSDPEQTELDVSSAVSRMASAVADDYPAATIEVDTPDSAVARATPQLDQAIEELLVNAAVHSDREAPEIEVSVAADDDRVEVEIADDGPRIPEMERKVLVGGEAVGPLYHGSGLGLWLVYWIVTRSGGSLSFHENEPRGNVVRITLGR